MSILCQSSPSCNSRERMTICGCLLLLLLLSPLLASGSRSSAVAHLAQKPPTHFVNTWSQSGTLGQHQIRETELTQGYPSLFSTHSANPWSSRRGRWSRSQAGSVATRTIHVSHNESFFGFEGGEAGAHGGADLEEWSCPDSFTFLEWIRYLLRDDCKGSDNQVARTFITVVWLMVLFYLLGSTASDYFSCTLEKLSNTLKLSPAVAGVTLLAVGNGAPDVFSSVAAFMSSDRSGGIGFSCVLGGALFITTVVSGAVALVTARGPNLASIPKINLVCFVRDALFLLGSSAILAFIILDGKVYLWEAALFLSVYVIYAITVWAAEALESHAKDTSLLEAEDPFLPKVMIESSLPQSLHLQQHLYHLHSREFEAELESFEQEYKVRPMVAKIEHWLLFTYKHGIERPLALPRQLTIPIIEEERWSRFFAVASSTLAPLFVCGVWILKSDMSTEMMYAVFGISACLGIAFGTLAFLNTESAKPPSQFVWLWLGGGFFMSIVWFYIVADQVVASLETLGVIFSINPAILGLTVLAWGNCIGDLVADLALACGGRDGVQIAVVGCYAGPLFNMVVGLGLSLVLACWRSNPDPLVISDEDGTLFFIIGFLAVGLIWALVVLPLNNMRLSKGFGAGLLLFYCGFLVAGMCYAMGWISR